MKCRSLTKLKQVIESCRLCPRLVHYREKVPVKPRYKDQPYWRKPIAGFGDPESSLFILGLAPAAHGGNRTGRVFTGDASGDFLFKVLYSIGMANQSSSVSREDGLKLKNCYITAAVKCAPPLNKPTKLECMTCAPYWHSELALLKNVSSVLVLGKFAFDAFVSYLRLKGYQTKGLLFKHGANYSIKGLATLYVSYHPSPRNTQTGTLTFEMLQELLLEIINPR